MASGAIAIAGKKNRVEGSFGEERSVILYHPGGVNPESLVHFYGGDDGTKPSCIVAMKIET